MLKVIELDGPGRDADGLVFTLTIGNDRFGVTDQEVAELIRAKFASTRQPARKGAQRRTNASEPAQAENLANAAEGDARPAADVLVDDASAH